MATELTTILELIEVQQPSKIVADLSNAPYFGSTMLQALTAIWSRLRSWGGTVILCNLSETGREALHLTRFDTLWPIVHSLDDAIAYPEGVVADCPVHQCGGKALPSRDAKLPEGHPVGLLFGCLHCDAEIEIRGPALPQAETWQAKVRRFAIPTYEGESVQAISPGWHSGNVPIPLYKLAIVGRLDLFAADVLRRAWLTVRPPRRILVDLDEVTEVSPRGGDELGKLCETTDQDSRTAVLRGEASQRLGQDLAPSIPLQANLDEAISSLGEIPDQAKQPMIVTLCFAARDKRQ